MLVAGLQSARLAQAVQVFAVLQGAALLSVSAARDSPFFGQRLNAAATWANLVNFDIEVLKAGCDEVPVSHRRAEHARAHKHPAHRAHSARVCDRSPQTINYVRKFELTF